MIITMIGTAATPLTTALPIPTKPPGYNGIMPPGIPE